MIGLDVAQKKHRRYGEIDIAGDLHAIPCRDRSFDAIVNVEVLEHLEEPEIALREMFRVLKPSGRLYLVAPQGWEEHCIPRDFFRFTRFGLQHVFEKTGYRVLSITPLGGYFWYIGHRGEETVLDVELARRTMVPYVCFYLDRLDSAEPLH